MRPHEDLFYDFDRDAWIEAPGVHARWNDRELPTPREAPAPGLWTRPPGRFRIDHVQRNAAYLGLATTLAALVTHRFFLIPVAGGFMGLVQLLTTLGLPLRAVDRRLLEDPDDLDVCLVDLRIDRGRRTVGLDRGVVWFDAGRLVFNGHRTSFAIGGEDVLPRSQWHPFRRDRTLLLPLRVPTGRATLVFGLVTGSLDPGERERRLVERLHAFRQRPPRSRGPRQWPPLQ